MPPRRPKPCGGNKKQGEKSLSSFISRVNFMHIVDLSWEFKPSIYFKKEKKATKSQHCFKALVESIQTKLGNPAPVLFYLLSSCILINKLLKLRLEVQQKRKNKKRKNSIILNLSGRESLEACHTTWLSTRCRSTFPSDCLTCHRGEYTSPLTDCSVHQYSNCYNLLVWCRLSSRTCCLPFFEDLTKPPTM